MLLLHFQSNHPLHTKESIIYSQALRYNLIINDDTQLQNELYHLTRTLLARKYPLHIINRNIIKTLKFSRQDLLHKTKTPSTKTNFLPFGIYEKDSHLKDTIDRHWHILTDDITLNSILPDKPTASLKRNTTLANILVRSDTL